LAEPQPEEDVVHSQGDSNDTLDYTPLSDPDNSDSEPAPVQATTEFRLYGEESPILLMQLHDLFLQSSITRAPKYRVKGVPRPGCMAITCIVKVFDGQELVSKHASPAPRATCAKVVAEAAGQALMSWNCSQHRDLKNSIYALYP
jgi:hypothetical protein